MPFAEGDIGGVNGDGDIIGTEDGEPGRRFMTVLYSIAEAPEVAEPVETYSGRSSSVLCAKKQTLLEQFVPSLQSRVRYCAGCSQHSNTP